MLTWLWISGLALLFGPRSTPKPSAVGSFVARPAAGAAEELAAADCQGPYSPWTNSSQETPLRGGRVAMNSAPTEGVRTVHLPQIKSTVPVYKNPGNCKRAVEFTHEQWQYACRKPACRLRGRLVEELQELCAASSISLCRHSAAR